MEPQDDYYEQYYGKLGRRRKAVSWRFHVIAVALVLAVGAVVVMSGVADQWMQADYDHEAHTIEPENLDALR